ncbi:hypothetical protein HMPREF9123_2090 [Neisseria bacilliformis ATCC BAA-1200]|uniref:Uncharacterized protein n=1 Tax=Neisseria bacilliformis ATCC BAA-1200 TaxID=888742 RepID=F2BED4_9NEIS|nr:hypothetical protein HMPREF9123_2090 [Neisseria bacilliformis ATCC BAA-1200]
MLGLQPNLPAAQQPRAWQATHPALAVRGRLKMQRSRSGIHARLTVGN